LGEGEGSAGAPRCCVTPYFLFKNCWMQRSKKLLSYLFVLDCEQKNEKLNYSGLITIIIFTISI